MLSNIRFGGIYKLISKPLNPGSHKRLKRFQPNDDMVIARGIGHLNSMGIWPSARNFCQEDDTFLVLNDRHGNDLAQLEERLYAPTSGDTETVKQQFFERAQAEKRVMPMNLWYSVQKHPENSIFAWKAGQLLALQNGQEYRLCLKEIETPTESEPDGLHLDIYG